MLFLWVHSRFWMLSVIWLPLLKDYFRYLPLAFRLDHVIFSATDTICISLYALLPQSNVYTELTTQGWIYSGSQTVLLEHFCLTSAIVIWVAGHGPASWLSGMGLCNSRNEVLVGWWTSDIPGGHAVSHMLLLKIILEFTFAILIPRGNITVQLLCCIPYIIP